MTKEQILASNEPRTIKLIEFINSWGDKVGEGGHQWIGEEYFNQQYVWSCWTMMYNLSIPYVFTKTLRLGSKGFDVKMLQTKLSISLIDGIFGKQTLSSVIKFQLSHNLTADGIVGPKTNAILNL